MITSLASYKGFIGYTSSDRDAAYSYILSAMSAAIKRRTKVQLEQATYTVIVTPPASQELVLNQVPVSSITSIHLNPDAGGQSANFTSDYLLDSSTYFLKVDESGYSRSGIVVRVGRLWSGAGLLTSPSIWGGAAGYGWGGYVGVGAGLTRSVAPPPGALKVVYVAGYQTVPDDIQLACWLATTRIFQTWREYAGVTSGSWNGASLSFNSIPAGTMAGVLDTPEIAGLLAPYIDPVFGSL